MIDFIGKLHPLVVHFPVALVLVAGLGAVLGRRVASLAAAVPVLAALGAFGAVGATLTGWAFAVGESAAGDTAVLLERHRWSGTIAAVVVVVAALALRRPGARQAPWLVIAGLVVAVTAHLGGTLVFGETHWSEAPPLAVPMPVTAALPRPPVVPRADGITAPAAVEFATVDTIFKRSCVRCHDVRKKKGGLRLDDRAAAFAGGESGVVIIPGNASGSLLIERVSLPTGAKGHMPSKGDPLSSDDIGVLKRWVDEGARWN